MTKLLKVTTIILATIILGVVVSGCVKKSATVPAVIPEQSGIQNNTTTDSEQATTTAEIDTTNWKTYRNEEYGFEFKYPGDYGLVRENDLEIVFEKVIKSGIPSSKINLKLYPSYTIEDVINFREAKINDSGIFNINFKKLQSSGVNLVYGVDVYSDAMGATRYSEKIIQEKDASIVISIQVSDTIGNEFKNLYKFLSQMDNL